MTSEQKWPLVYIAILDGKPAICPECGGSVRHSFFADADRLGYGLLECNHCQGRFVLSRVRFPESVTDIKIWGLDKKKPPTIKCVFDGWRLLGHSAKTLS